MKKFIYYFTYKSEAQERLNRMGYETEAINGRLKVVINEDTQEWAELEAKVMAMYFDIEIIKN